MKTINISDVNFFDIINEATKKSFREQLMKTINLTGATNQYILLSKYENGALHNGVISLSCANPSSSLISLFSITVNEDRVSVNSSNANLKFYKLSYAGVDYIAISKPNPDMNRSSLQSFAVNYETYEFKELHAFNASNVVAL